MQVADIISWSLGGFACFHKREVALYVFVHVEEKREKRFQMDKTKSCFTVCIF